MQLTVNGDALEITDGSTVGELLKHLQIGRERVAVEVNMDIVPKAAYDTQMLSPGDRVEVVHFVGGG